PRTATFAMWVSLSFYRQPIGRLQKDAASRPAILTALSLALHPRLIVAGVTFPSILRLKHPAPRRRKIHDDSFKNLADRNVGALGSPGLCDRRGRGGRLRTARRNPCRGPGRGRRHRAAACRAELFRPRT